VPKTPAPKSAGEWPVDLDQGYVYEAYDCIGRLLYIGVTNDLATRLAKHRNESPWFISAARVVWTQYETRTEAGRAEEQLIRERLPEHNVVFNEDRQIALSMRHEHLYPSSAWKRLGEVIRQERGRRRLSQRSVAQDGRLDIAVLRGIEAGETTRYTLDQLERLHFGMGWQAGSVERVLQGGDPEPLTPELRSLRAQIVYDTIDVMGGV
jgi:predicted GIY-YIG superfamily endonuclease